MLDKDELNAALDASPSPRRVTPEYINSRIVDTNYFRLNPTVTVCQIDIDNGFSVRGESACVDPANYRQDIGERIAYDNAYRQLWPLFGFLLAEKIHRKKLYDAIWEPEPREPTEKKPEWQTDTIDGDNNGRE